MRRIKNWAAAAVCGLTLVANAFGQQKGDKLVVVAKNAEMKSEATVVQTVCRGNPLVVQEVNGPWLWVHLFGKSGWIHSRDVVLEGREMDYWNEVLHRDPRDYDALVARAQILIVQDDLTGALAGATEAIRVDPKQDWAYRVRSSVWERKGEYDLALADANEAIHVEPQKALPYLKRGAVYKMKGEYDKALVDLNESLRLDPTNAQTFEQRGFVFNLKKEFDKAIADFTSAIRIDKKSSVAYAGRGYARSKTQDFRGALSDCDEAIQLNPKSTSALGDRATLHGTMGRPAQALADLEHILRLKPDDAQSLNGVAWLLATCPTSEVRNGRRAVELAKMAVELSKKHGNADPNILDTLAAAYAEAGDFSNATRTQQQAIEQVVAAKKADYTTRLELYKLGQPYREVLKTETVAATAAR